MGLFHSILTHCRLHSITLIPKHSGELNVLADRVPGPPRSLWSSLWTGGLLSGFWLWPVVMGCPGPKWTSLPPGTMPNSATSSPLFQTIEQSR